MQNKNNVNLVPRASPLPFPWSERGRDEERPWQRGWNNVSLVQLKLQLCYQFLKLPFPWNCTPNFTKLSTINNWRHYYIPLMTGDSLQSEVGFCKQTIKINIKPSSLYDNDHSWNPLFIGSSWWQQYYHNH